MNHPTIKKALKIMESQLREDGTENFSRSETVKAYARLQLAYEPDEVMCVFFLDNINRLLSFDKMFRGTINESNIYARPIMRKIFEYNAAKIILAHNHPSGNLEPSKADIHITRKFKDLFEQVDCQVLDHIIVTPKNAMSFVEAGIF